MKRILVASDFSERSELAVRRASMLAREHDASILLLHVVDSDGPEDLVKAAQDNASAFLQKQVAALQDAEGVNSDFSVVGGVVFEEIVNSARANAAELLVVGSHRRQILKDVFVGTTVERTIRETVCPVLMVNAVPERAYRRIIIATDLSKCSAEAVRAVVNLGLSDKAEVFVLYAYDVPMLGLNNRASLSREEFRRYLQEQEYRASQELSDFLVKHKLEPAQRILKPADRPVDEIIMEVAGDKQAELIAVGTHGRSGISKALLGSVAERVLGKSILDVLVVPPAPA